MAAKIQAFSILVAGLVLLALCPVAQAQIHRVALAPEVQDRMDAWIKALPEFDAPYFQSLAGELNSHELLPTFAEVMARTGLWPDEIQDMNPRIHETWVKDQLAWYARNRVQSVDYAIKRQAGADDFTAYVIHLEQLIALKPLFEKEMPNVERAYQMAARELAKALASKVRGAQNLLSESADLLQDRQN